MSRKIHIFDTTLRDGEQVPGAKLNKRQKLEIAHQLAKLGVDIIEGGFPCSSPGDLAAVQAIAREVRGPVIAALARAVQTDIDAAWEAVREAERPRIHVFLGSSDIHLQKKLRRDRGMALQMAVNAVRHAKVFCQDVEFSTEDGSRTDFEFLCRIIDATIKAGATVINVPDTVGYAVPEEYGDLIHRLRENVPALDAITLSVHCHNDLGLAVANSLTAIKNGATQVECTVNGIGERAGNASLEEIVMVLKTRFANEVHTGINTKEIYRTSRMVSRLMNIPVQPNKAIVGGNAFTHSSGVHQDGVLKDRNTYEIMKPEDLGISQRGIILTARSGRSGLMWALDDLGFSVDKDSEVFERIYNRFISIADQKTEVAPEDVRLIAEIEIHQVPETYKICYLHINTGLGIIPTAVIGLERNGAQETKTGQGNGALDAASNAIEKITGVKGKVLDHYQRSVTAGKDALAETVAQVEINGTVYSGIGTTPDTATVLIYAYLNAINRYLANGGSKS